LELSASPHICDDGHTAPGIALKVPPKYAGDGTSADNGAFENSRMIPEPYVNIGMEEDERLN